MMNECTDVTMESQAGQCTIIGKGVQFTHAGCIDRPTECASGSIFANRVSFTDDIDTTDDTTVTGKGCVSAAGICRFGHVGFQGRCAPAAEVCAVAEGYDDTTAACDSTPTAAQCDALGRLIQGTGCITQAQCGDAADEFIAAHTSTCVTAAQCPMQDNSAILNGRCVSTASPDNCLAIGRYLSSGNCVVPTTAAQLRIDRGKGIQ